MVIKEAVATIREQRDKLDQVLKLLGELDETPAPVSRVTGPAAIPTKKKRRFSAEARRRMSEAQRRRHGVAVNQDDKLTRTVDQVLGPPKAYGKVRNRLASPYNRTNPHWTQTPEGRKKLGAMSRKMWKTRHAGA